LMIGWPCCILVQTLLNLQLEAQNSYLFTYNTFIKILYMFLALPCSSSGGLRHNCIYAACGIVTVCRWLSCAPVRKNKFCRWLSCAPVRKNEFCRWLSRAPINKERVLQVTVPRAPIKKERVLQVTVPRAPIKKEIVLQVTVPSTG
jgi:hypothetical protein